MEKKDVEKFIKLLNLFFMDSHCKEFFGTHEKLYKSMEKVANRFKNTMTKDIVLISHDEPAWTENKINENVISYQYAFDLKALN